MSWPGRVLALLLVAAPFVVYGFAQTSRLHAAAAAGDLEDVQRALKPWKQVDGLDSGGRTPLGVALQRTRVDIAEFLLAHGASVQARTGTNRRIDYLEESVRRKRPEFVALFLKQGGTLDFSAALRVAARNADVATVRLLLERGAVAGDAVPAALALSRDHPNRQELLVLLYRHGARVDPPPVGPN